MRLHYAAVMFLISTSMTIGGCASSDAHRHFSEAESHLNTGGTITRAFHSVLYYPDQIQLNTDGYIVGVEKSDKAKVLRAGDIRVRAMPEVGFATAADAARKLDDPKIFHVSHVIERTAKGNCPLYNLYSEISPARSQFFGSDCALPVRPDIDSVAKIAVSQGAYAQSWHALNALQVSLTAQLTTAPGMPPRYTHLVVVTMGWNTPQDEAVRNFNSIMRNFAAAMKQRSIQTGQPDQFRPLLVGVTWPSQWSSAWFDPALKLFSFSSKAEDADQLGLSWLGVMMHETIPGAIEAAGRRNNLPVIAIGHSFGSRAMSTAVCAGPAIYHIDKIAPVAQVDYLINYQGAFLSKRLFENVSEYGMHYPLRCPNARSLVLTASAADTANTKPIWGAYAGEKKAWAAECGVANPLIECRVARETGLLEPSSLPRQRIVYIDADALIAENAHDTGGGSHSDIFRPEHGVLLRELTGKTSP